MRPMLITSFSIGNFIKMVVLLWSLIYIIKIIVFYNTIIYKIIVLLLFVFNSIVLYNSTNVA